MNEVPVNVPRAGTNTHIIGTNHGGISYSTNEKGSSKIADDESAAAIINNLVRAGAANNPLNAKNDLSITSIIRESLQNLKLLASRLENRLRDYGNNIDSFQDNGIFERLKEQVETFSAGKALENLKKEIEALSNNSSNLERLKKEIEAIMSFEESLLGIQEEMDRLTEYIRSRVEEVSDSEGNEAKVVDNLELGRFTAARMKDEALKVLWGQANLEPGRVLSFLKNTAKISTDENENNV